MNLYYTIKKNDIKRKLSIYYYYIAIGLMTFYLNQSSWAQEKATPKSAIKEADFLIEKEKKNILPESTRFFKKAPLPPVEEKLPITFNYSIPDQLNDFQFLEHQIQFLCLEDDLLKQMPSHPYVRIGHGNHYMPYVGFWWEQRLLQKYHFSYHVSHLSKGKKDYFEAQHNQLRLTAALPLGTWLLKGGAKYHFEQHPLLAVNDLDNSYTKDDNGPYHSCKYHLIHASAVFCKQENAKASFVYQFNTEFASQTIHNRPGLYENIEKGTLQIGYTINKQLSIGADLNLQIAQFKIPQLATKHQQLGSLTPILSINVSQWRAYVGGVLSYHHYADTLFNKHFYFHPKAEFTYTVYKYCQPFVGIKGRAKVNYWQQITGQNPFFLETATIFPHRNQALKCYGGCMGKIFYFLDYQMGVSRSNLHQLPCFVNSSQDKRYFDLQYDPDVTCWRVFAELIQTDLIKGLTTRIHGKYYYYQLSQLARPWHRPNYALKIDNRYCFKEVLLLKSRLSWLGGLAAQDLNNQAEIDLPDNIDLSFGVTYLWSPHFSVFLDINNIFARDNNRYLNTPTNDFLALLGIAYVW